MKRVFTLSGLTAVFVLLVLNYFLEKQSLIFAAVMSVLFIVSLVIVKLKHISAAVSVIFFTAFLFSLVFYIRSVSYLKNEKAFVDNTENQYVEITGKILDSPTISSGGNYCYTVKTDSVNGEKKKLKIKLYIPYDPLLNVYDEISYTSRLFIIGDNNYSQMLYFRSKGNSIGTYSYYIDHIKPYDGSSPLYHLFKFKYEREKIVRSVLPGDNAEFSVAVLFGDKTFMSDELKDNLKVSGLSHITAVSGLHMSIWVMGLYYILKKFNLNQKAVSLLCIVFSALVLILSGFSVSCLRSALMLFVYLLGKMTSNRSDSLNSLGFACFVICAFNPFVVCDVSFLLSAFSTLGILTFYSVLPKKLKISNEDKSEKAILRIADPILLSLICSVSALIFSAPITLKFFGTVAVFSVLSNLLCFFLITPCLILSGLVSIFPGITLFQKILVFIENYIFFISDKISSISFSQFVSQNTVVAAIISVCISVVIFALYSLRKKKITVSPVIVLLTYILISFLPIGA